MLRITIGKIFRSYSELLSNFVLYCSRRNLPYGLLRRPCSQLYEGGAKLASSLPRDKIIVKHLRRRQYDLGIIEKTIGLVMAHLQPSVDLSIVIWLTGWWGLHDGPYPNLLKDTISRAVSPLIVILFGSPIVLRT